MPSVSSRIWTRVAVSITYNDNHHTTGTSKKAGLSPSLTRVSDSVFFIKVNSTNFFWTSMLFTFYAIGSFTTSVIPSAFVILLCHICLRLDIRVILDAPVGVTVDKLD